MVAWKRSGWWHTLVEPQVDKSSVGWSWTSHNPWVGKVPLVGIGSLIHHSNHSSHTTELIANKQVQETELSASLLELKNLTHFPIFLHPMSLPMLAS